MHFFGIPILPKERNSIFHISMSDPTLSVCVRLSRKAYFPGAVVSGIVTLEPIRESETGEYLSIISAQV